MDIKKFIGVFFLAFFVEFILTWMYLSGQARSIAGGPVSLGGGAIVAGMLFMALILFAVVNFLIGFAVGHQEKVGLLTGFSFLAATIAIPFIIFWIFSLVSSINSQRNREIRANAIFNSALEKNDPGMCDSLGINSQSEQINRYACMVQVALKTRDVKVCNLLDPFVGQNSVQRFDCINDYSALAGDISSCNMSSDPRSCIVYYFDHSKMIPSESECDKFNQSAYDACIAHYRND